MQIPAPTDMIARVTAGADWLDQHQAGWYWRVDLDRLDVRRSCSCLLGQLFGDYAQAPLSVAQAVELGFDTTVGAHTADRGPDVDQAITAEFDALSDLWRTVVLHRRRGIRGHRWPLLALTCTGRAVDEGGQPVGDPCGAAYPVADRRFPSPAVRDEAARAAGWRIGPRQPDGTRHAMCPGCARPDPTTAAACRDLRRSTR